MLSSSFYASISASAMASSSMVDGWSMVDRVISSENGKLKKLCKRNSEKREAALSHHPGCLLRNRRRDRQESNNIGTAGK